MPEPIRYGLDFSRGGFPTPAQIRAAGADFVIRYATRDASPAGRAITGPEYARYRDSGIDVVLVWESSIGRMRDGKAAGVEDAKDALANNAEDELPGKPPIYFAFDDDATEDDQGAINDYLDGVASVIGREHTGIYGGYWPVMRAAKAGKAHWFWQTRAWSGSNVFEGAHLLQYPYQPNDDPRNTPTVGGVACDLNAAFKVDFGQLSKHGGAPLPALAFDPAAVWKHTSGPVGQLWAKESAKRHSYGRPDSHLWGVEDGHGHRLYGFTNGLVIRYDPATKKAEVV